MIQDNPGHRLSIAWHEPPKPEGDETALIFSGKKLFLKSEGGHYTLPRCRETAGPYRYLFDFDGIPVFLAESADGFDAIELREVRERCLLPQEMAFVAYTAWHLAGFYRDNRFCGSCATAMEESTKERALVCPKCGKTVYPRLNPAVIVGVLDGERMLVTKYAGRSFTHYALVAGFVEIGETLEDTVRREVFEETGLAVKNIRYAGSQPWGIASDILTGFYCDVDGSTEIHLDTSELKIAEWKTREEIVLQPDSYSLTNDMMRRFKEGRSV